jgi:hypothetical protein
MLMLTASGRRISPASTFFHLCFGRMHIVYTFGDPDGSSLPPRPPKGVCTWGNTMPRYAALPAALRWLIVVGSGCAVVLALGWAIETAFGIDTQAQWFAAGFATLAVIDAVRRRAVRAWAADLTVLVMVLMRH